jgi:hypothetical protein
LLTIDTFAIPAATLKTLASAGRFLRQERRGSSRRPLACAETSLLLSFTAMDLNRNQFFFIGLVILLLGLQLRFVSAYVLNPEATQFLAERSGEAPAAAASIFNLTSTPAMGRKVVQPPEWLGWCLISVGAVLILHSLAMPKPGGA